MSHFYVTAQEKMAMEVGQTHILVFVCDSLEEAKIVQQNARDTSHMVKVSEILNSKPQFNKNFVDKVQIAEKHIWKSYYESVLNKKR